MLNFVNLGLVLALGVGAAPVSAQTFDLAQVQQGSEPAQTAPASCDSASAGCAQPPEGSEGLADEESSSLTDNLVAPSRLSDAPPAAEAQTGDVPEMLPLLPEAPTRRWTDHSSAESSTHRGVFSQLGTIKTETLLLVGYFAAQSGKKLFRDTTSFHFRDEGFFGKNTTNLGVDKITHAFDTYLLADIIHMRLHKKTNASHGDALTASLLATTLMALNELSDGIEPDSGYSMQDIAMNFVGAGFSYLRNTVPGLKEKVAFKIEIVPNDNIYSYRGAKHYEQQRFMFSFMGSGFEAIRNTPLRFVDLQIGYYASNLWGRRRAEGKEPKRHLFVGVGLNLGEILFANSRTRVGKAAYTVLDYFQVPYTSIR